MQELKVFQLKKYGMNFNKEQFGGCHNHCLRIKEAIYEET